MATTKAHNPTVNLFELLQVDQDLPEPTNQQQPKKSTGPGQPETPAERGQRRAAAQAEKAQAQAAAKAKADQDAALAKLIPLDGFQVQKGSQPKKTEKQTKTLNREEFQKQPEGKKFQSRGPGEPKKFDAERKGDRQHKPREQQPNRPPRHEGFDKHSGGKTGNKPYSKKEGHGTANWGNEIADVPTVTSGGWGDDSTKAQNTVAGGWGDEKEQTSAPAQSEGETKTEEKKEDAKEPREPARAAWDDEGFGKMTLEQYQKTVEAKRAADLAALTGVIKPRTAETVDLSKFSLKETGDEKEKKLAGDKKVLPEKKTKPQRAGQSQADVSTIFNVRQGGRGGGRGGDRPPRDNQEAAPQQSEKPNKGGRGGGGGRGNRVPPPKAFPGLPTPAKSPELK